MHLENPDGPYLLHPIVPGEKFVVTWTHQLHCLVSGLNFSFCTYAKPQFHVMNEYDRLLRHGPNGKERSIPPGSNSVHTGHCFEILRHSILCHLDMTLEGSHAPPYNGTTGIWSCACVSKSAGSYRS